MIAVQVWRIVPLAAVIIMAGLGGDPQEINDAAQVDGAGFWRKLFEVTIPMSLPVTAVATLFGAVLVFTDMGVVYVLTRGGPIDATQVLPDLGFLPGHPGRRPGPGGGGRPLPASPCCWPWPSLILRSVRKMEVM